MSVRLQVTGHAPAPVSTVWSELIDWEGQRRWIPFTTVRVTSPSRVGLGVRAEALSGFWLGPVPVGLLDRFVVTGWTPPGSGLGRRPPSWRSCTSARTSPAPACSGSSRRRRRHDDPLHRAVRAARRPAHRDAGSTRPAGDAARLPAEPGQARRRLRRSAAGDRAVVGADGRARCPWATSTPEYIAYHDDEWGRPVRTVDGPLRAPHPGGVPVRAQLADHPAQAGELPPRLRPVRSGRRRGVRVRPTSSGCSVTPGSSATGARSTRPSTTPPWWPGSAPSSWRSSRRYEQPDRPRPATLAEVPASTPESIALARELKKHGIRFVGPTTAYALMQAVGLVDDHLQDCQTAP